jgi:hypothetical protein
MSSLFNLYLTVLKSKHIQDTEGLRSTIGVILAVAPFRPLCDKTIAKLLDIEGHVIKNQVDMLSSLFYRDESMSSGIRVRHLSIFEFLADKSCPEEYRVNLDQANMEMGCSCLKTMIKELKFNICGLETSMIPNDEVKGLDNLKQGRISDALQYGCPHWADHLFYASDYEILPDACRLIDGVFEGIKSLFWMEVLSLMGRVPVGISSLRKLLTHIRVSIRSYI